MVYIMLMMTGQKDRLSSPGEQCIAVNNIIIGFKYRSTSFFEHYKVEFVLRALDSILENIEEEATRTVSILAKKYCFRRMNLFVLVCTSFSFFSRSIIGEMLR